MTDPRPAYCDGCAMSNDLLDDATAAPADDDDDAGQFTYFAFSPDTMETTYHLEFRYAEKIEDLQSWFEGEYAYWNVGAIAADYTDETMRDVITLFATENLSSEE